MNSRRDAAPSVDGWHNTGRARIEVSVIVLGELIVGVAAGLFIKYGMYMGGDMNARLTILVLLAGGVILTLEGIRMRVKMPDTTKEWVLHMIVPAIISLAAIPIYIVTEYTQVQYAYALYAVGVIWLTGGILRQPLSVREATPAAQEITPERAFLNVSRALNEKIQVIDELLAHLSDIQSNLDLTPLRSMLSECENVADAKRKRLTLERNRLIIRLFEIADNCTTMIERGKKSREIDLILEQVQKVLEMETGIVPMKITVGEDTFDPNKHEIRDFDYRDDLPESTIMRVFRDGYIDANSGNVERPAFVAVVKHKRM